MNVKRKEGGKMNVKRMIRILAVASALALGSAATAAPIMHVHDSQGNLGTVDVATGNVTVIGNMGVVMTDIAFDPSGNLYGISFTNLYSINPGTAAATFIGGHGVPGGNALVFATDGTLYAAGFSGTNLYRINPANGATTDLGNMGFTSGGDLAFNAGKFYLADGLSRLVRIDLANLANTTLVGSFGVPSVFGLATGDDGLLYAVAGTTIYTVNTSTGAATNPVSFASQGLGTAFGQSFRTEAVPEPATLLLLSVMLLGLAVARGRYGRAARPAF